MRSKTAQTQEDLQYTGVNGQVGGGGERGVCKGQDCMGMLGDGTEFLRITMNRDVHLSSNIYITILYSHLLGKVGALVVVGIFYWFNAI